MFERLGKLAARRWPMIIAAWAALFIGLTLIAPKWESIVEDGEFRYLPTDMPSRVAQELFLQVFSRDFLGCNVVIVVCRERGNGLTTADFDFIEQTLKPRLEEIARNNGGLKSDERRGHDAGEGPSAVPVATQTPGTAASSGPISVGVRTYADNAVGHLLTSRDNKASLVIIELTTEFTEERNVPLISKVEELVKHKGLLFSENLIPAGLSLKLSGTATVGRDTRDAEAQSADATEAWTVVLVIVLLTTIYAVPAIMRWASTTDSVISLFISFFGAMVVALIPLATVAASVHIALSGLSLFAKADAVDLFSGIEVYVTVVLYGAGVDFCIFLIARYKEELDAGATRAEATAAAVKNVGSAITASAGTTMCGIGMMYFADFGKFKQAGIAMSSSLAVVLVASLTLAPALLRMVGRLAFWRYPCSEQVAGASGWLSPTSLTAKLMAQGWLSGVWDKIGRGILARPLTVWLSCITVMFPFAVFGAFNFNFLSYGLLSELPDDSPSVEGAMQVQKYFPAGETAPITALFLNRSVSFRDRDTGIPMIRELTRRLYDRREELGIDDIRSVSHPLGSNPEDLAKMPIPKINAIRIRAPEYYVSDKGELADHVTRFDIVLQNDPFSRHSMDQFDRLKLALVEEIERPSSGLAGETEVSYVGATANIRDLKEVTARDQLWVDTLVMISVFLVLVVLLRRIGVCAYLLATVLFGYLVTLGVTFALFWSLDPAGFAGLDWKVPMFLFTILIAVGEDYNIYLITRIEEEQRKFGPVKGIPVALSITGGIISSCGLIMAGTFASLMSGTLEGMIQLGFALAFGVLLDTFVVRPILVPAYLVLLHSGRFGVFGKLLGAQYESPRRNRTPALEVNAETTDVSRR